MKYKNSPIYFVTSNRQKFTSLQKLLQPLGVDLKQLMSISYCNVPGSGKMVANLLIHIPYDTSIRNMQNNVS